MEDEESADESDGDEDRDALMAPNLSAIVDVTSRIGEARAKVSHEAQTWVDEAARWALIAHVRQVVAKATAAERKAACRAAKQAADRVGALRDITNVQNAEP